MYYATFKVRKCDSLFYKINTFLQKNIALELRIDGAPRLLIIPFFAALPNLIQHSPFINFGEFWPVSPFIPYSPFINSCAQSTAVA